MKEHKIKFYLFQVSKAKMKSSMIQQNGPELMTHPIKKNFHRITRLMAINECIKQAACLKFIFLNAKKVTKIKSLTNFF